MLSAVTMKNICLSRKWSSWGPREAGLETAGCGRAEDMFSIITGKKASDKNSLLGACGGLSFCLSENGKITADILADC